MKLPSKTIPYQKSIIAQFPKILEPLQEKDIPVPELLRYVTDKDISISDFISILDCLYALGTIELAGGNIHYVKEH